MSDSNENYLFGSKPESKGSTLYDLLGGRRTLEKVHKIFYDKLYVFSEIIYNYNIVQALYCSISNDQDFFSVHL